MPLTNTTQKPWPQSSQYLLENAHVAPVNSNQLYVQDSPTFG